MADDLSKELAPFKEAINFANDCISKGLTDEWKETSCRTMDMHFQFSESGIKVQAYPMTVDKDGFGNTDTLADAITLYTHKKGGILP